jgi:hypothetical protein
MKNLHGQVIIFGRAGAKMPAKSAVFFDGYGRPGGR